jgi:hypothetical protein
MSGEYSMQQDRIREKAYELWEAAGSPDGGEDRFWSQAKIEIEQKETKLDGEAAGSFPASDISSVVTGAPDETKLAQD